MTDAKTETVDLYVVQWQDEYDGKWRPDNSAPILLDLQRARDKCISIRGHDGVMGVRIVRIRSEVVT